MLNKIVLVELGESWGGQEAYIEQLSMELSRNGHSVTLITPHTNNQYSSINYIKCSHKYSDFQKTKRLVEKTSKNADLIHYNGIRAVYLSHFIRKTCAFVSTKHLPYNSGRSASLKQQFLRIVSPLLFSKITRNIAISNSIQNELPICLQKKSSIILNGVPDKNYGIEDLSKSKTFTICYVGKLVKHKGVIKLIEAAKILSQKSVQFRLFLLGDGPIKSIAEELIKRENLSENVKLLGFVREPEKIMRRSHLCVLPSSHEGLPLVLLEAMSVYCPIACHQIPGTDDFMIDGVNGVLLGFSPSEIAEKIYEIYVSKQLQRKLQSGARLDYEQRWSSLRMFEETKQVYYQAIKDYRA